MKTRLVLAALLFAAGVITAQARSYDPAPREDIDFDHNGNCLDARGELVMGNVKYKYHWGESDGGTGEGWCIDGKREGGNQSL